MFNDPDILSLVSVHIGCTRTLLLLRATCRSARDELSIERIMGMSTETLRALACPDVQYVMGSPQTVWPDDIGACFTDQGGGFWTWASTTCGKLTINKYALLGGEWAPVTRYEASVPHATYLWLHITDGGLICTLSVVDDDWPIMFSASVCHSSRPVLQTKLDRSLLLENGSYEDAFAPEIYRFRQENILFAGWKGRSFLAVVPNSYSSLGLLQIKAEGAWTWWDVHTGRAPHVRTLCQSGKRIYAMQGSGGMLMALDLEDEEPKPELVDVLPMLPTIVSSIQVDLFSRYLFGAGLIERPRAGLARWRASDSGPLEPQAVSRDQSQRQPHRSRNDSGRLLLY